MVQRRERRGCSRRGERLPRHRTRPAACVNPACLSRRQARSTQSRSIAHSTRSNPQHRPRQEVEEEPAARGTWQGCKRGGKQQDRAFVSVNRVSRIESSTWPEFALAPPMSDLFRAFAAARQLRVSATSRGFCGATHITPRAKGSRLSSATQRHSHKMDAGASRPEAAFASRDTETRDPETRLPPLPLLEGGSTRGEAPRCRAQQASRIVAEIRVARNKPEPVFS